jgi:hypothetical protein
MNMNNFNGRVNIIQQPNTQNQFALYDRIPAKQCTTYRNPTTGIFDDTPLIQEFFSKQNIERIQNGIRNGVYRMSNGQYQIGPQDCDALKIIMRSIYLQNSVNIPTDIEKQVNALNQLVLQYTVKQVYEEAKGYLKYLYDASTMYTPMEHPTLSYTNDKQLEFKTWF